jgi:hypothetical protein
MPEGPQSQKRKADVIGTIRLYRGEPEIVVKSRAQISLAR